MKTDQEIFWQGEFGNDYIGRNKSMSLLASNVSLFSDILKKTNNVSSVLELGCNVGMNLKAIHQLCPDSSLTGIEINKKACEELEFWGKANVINESILDCNIKEKYDFVFTKTVLIHVNPKYLNDVYSILYKSTNKYILIAEYFNPNPVEIVYRGHEEKLFKRDFCGDMLDIYNDLKLLDYGFIYSRDNNFPQDNINWFLLEK